MTDKRFLDQIGFQTEHHEQLVTIVLAKLAYKSSYLEVTEAKFAGEKERNEFFSLRELYCRWYLGEPLEMLIQEYSGVFEEGVEREIRHDLQNARGCILGARHAKLRFEFTLRSCIELLYQFDVMCDFKKKNIFSETRQKALQFVSEKLAPV